MRIFLSLLLAAWWVSVSNAEARLVIASNGKPRVVLWTQKGASPAELRAAKELQSTLKQLTGAEFELSETSGKVPKGGIIVGPGAAAQTYFPDLALERFGEEEFVMVVRGGRLLLAGGRPRGTLYAVSRFLQTQGQVRWWTPWAASVPKRPDFAIRSIFLREKPVFESRDTFWFSAFDGEWAMRHFSNGQSARLTEELGGAVRYQGFVHTFNLLVPPESQFAAHPEWFSLIDGQRKGTNAQLCLSNPQLRDYVVDRVKAWLREKPEARIVSVSQNDCHGFCTCPSCKAIDDAEGSHAGSLLQFVNYVAAKIAPEFPNVAVDTLAYQYTRQAPKNILPLPNVIVRLCSIECNFAVPLTDPANASFAKDIRDWAKITSRLYIWDYTTDFAHYLQPHPNWFVLGPNVRFFATNSVRGLFEQGAYQSTGGEMAEMRAWVLAQLLWNPKQDDRKLIREFLDGYYGPAAAKPIAEYLDLMSQASKGFNLSCFSGLDAPSFKWPYLSEAEKLWQRAEEAAKNDPERLWRVRLSHLPVRYVWLNRWQSLREECDQVKGSWPLPASRKTVADEWLALATGRGPAGWAKITHLNESGLTPETFIARFAKDPEK
jgi:hypothetical protein